MLKFLSMAAVFLALGFSAPGCKEDKPAGPHAGHGPVLNIASLRSPDAPPPVGYEAVDHTFIVGTKKGVMKFDLETLEVKPGGKVKLVLKNTDDMPHNLLICKPGQDSTMEVAKAAWALGVDGPSRQYVPEHPLVLHHTFLVNPREADTLYFTAPTEEAEYPYVCTFPGHAFSMKGVMRVGKGAAAGSLGELVYKYYEGRWGKLPPFENIPPLAAGPVPEGLIDINLKHRPDAFGLVFTGKLTVPTAGKHTFFLNSDDGSLLLIDGKPVVDFDGLHSVGPEAKTGEVELKAGDHAIELRYFEAGGDELLQLSWSGPGFGKTKLYKGAGGTGPGVKSEAGMVSAEIVEKFHVLVTGTPRVVRCVMPDSSPKSIAVGLPGGINYCFDAEKCFVRYGWFGQFLDTAPDRGNGEGRGGGPNRPLGQRFSVGAEDFPLVFSSDASAREVQFKGYKLTPTPQFMYTINGRSVTQTVEPAKTGIGLTYSFEVDAPGGEVTFTLKPDGLSLTSSAGKWEGGKLTLTAAQAKKFSVTITEKK